MRSFYSPLRLNFFSPLAPRQQVNAHRQAFPELAKLRTACITDGFPLTLARDFEALKVDALSTGKDHVSPDLVADCQRRGIQVWAWTVNNVHFMKRLMVCYVSCAVCATCYSCELVLSCALYF